MQSRQHNICSFGYTTPHAAPPRTLFNFSQKVMDVIVIGCGASGVAALRRLHEAGVKALGLEAADRIGGRINSVPFGDGTVDLGAAWCQGEKDNIVYDMVKDMDVLGRSEPDHRWYVASDGSLIPNEKAGLVENTLFAAVDSADRNTTASLSGYVRQVANTIDVLNEEPSLKNSFVEWFERYNHVNGQKDIKTGKSLRGLEEFTPWAFMMNWKGKGYKTILDILLKRYPHPSEEIPVEILLKKEVESIKWKSAQSDVSTPLVHVNCRDGSLYAARSVIVTLSIGVLKERHQQLFNPPLPVEKVNAIQNLHMCVLGKIYIEFEEPWWPKSPANFTLLWRPEDKEKFTKEEIWITEVFNLNTVDYQPKVLLAWTYGEGAEQMEQLSLEEVKAGMAKLLDTVLGKQFNITPIKSIV
ncbi:hypothetical protein EVAR_73269_1, partial [Eumeta japonica]